MVNEDGKSEIYCPGCRGIYKEKITDAGEYLSFEEKEEEENDNNVENIDENKKYVCNLRYKNIVWRVCFRPIKGNDKPDENFFFAMNELSHWSFWETAEEYFQNSISEIESFGFVKEKNIFKND